MKKNYKNLLLLSFMFTILFLPLNTFAATEGERVNIVVNGISYDYISNYLDPKTERTYVSINDFCRQTKLCTIKSSNIVEQEIYSDSNWGTINNVKYVIEFLTNKKTIKNTVMFDNWGKTTSLGISKEPDTPVDTDVFRQSGAAIAKVTFVPIRFFAETMWYNVGWNGDTKTVSITTHNPTTKFEHKRGGKITSTNGCPSPEKYVVEGSELKMNTWENLKNLKNNQKVLTFQTCKGKFYIGEAKIEN